MKLLLIINILLSLWTKFNSIYEANLLKQKAALAYNNANYKQAIENYNLLLNAKKDKDEKILLNLAHCYYNTGNYYNASVEYKGLISSPDKKMRSIAYLQLGVIYSKNNKKESAIHAFKEALKADPSNESARYNYELLKKENDKEQKQISPDQKKENKNGKNQQGVNNSMEDRKNQTGEKGDHNNGQSEEGSGDEDSESGKEEDQKDLQTDENGNRDIDAMTSNRLGEMNINEQKAMTILNAMKNAEVQYIQQRRKSVSGKPLVGHPDW